MPTAPFALRVHDQDGNAFDVRFMVTAPTETGALSILTPEGEVTQQFELARLRKSRDGKTLSCRVGFTSATVTLDDTHAQPQLHIEARAFLPVFNAVYTLSQEERQRLSTWLQGLALKARA